MHVQRVSCECHHLSSCLCIYVCHIVCHLINTTFGRKSDVVHTRRRRIAAFSAIWGSLKIFHSDIRYTSCCSDCSLCSTENSKAELSRCQQGSTGILQVRAQQRCLPGSQARYVVTWQYNKTYSTAVAIATNKCVQFFICFYEDLRLVGPIPHFY
jgi:hypothetical protein